MNKKNIFHIGFFHSASKLLQSEIFPNIPNYNFPNYDKRLIKKATSYMPKNFGKNFYYEDPKIFKELNKFKKPYIYSSEAFSHLQEHNSYYKIKYRKENTFIGLLNLAKYIADTDSHLLFIIRNQKSIINSYYKRWSHLYKNENELFIDFPYEKNKHTSKRTLKFKSNYGMIYLNTFNYRLSLSIICNFVKKKNIHIIPYEYLLNNKKLFLDKLSKVFQKNLTFLLPKLYKKINSSEKIKNKGCSKKFLNEIHKEFAYDNKILDKSFNLNLKKFGYY